MQGSLRIIAGIHKGRKFDFVDADGLRPTTGKIRETLFNWINFEAANKTYLDLFAGSGSLSFEALSRGASEVISIEKNYQTFISLIKNKEKLSCSNIKVFNQDAFKFLAKNSNTVFDFVFVDPPFGKNLIENTLELLSTNNFVASGSKIYVESEYEISKQDVATFFTQDINIEKQKISGQVYYCLIKLL